MCLSDEEKEFLKKRKPKVMKAMQEILGEQGPKSINEVTNTVNHDLKCTQYTVIHSGHNYNAH